MTIYVDAPQTWNPRFENYCHMRSSQIDTDYEAGLNELYDMAWQLGLKEEYIHISTGMYGPFPHFDLSPAKRKKALKLGAQYMPLSDWIAQRPRAMRQRDEWNAKIES